MITEMLFCWIWKCFYMLDGLFFSFLFFFFFFLLLQKFSQPWYCCLFFKLSKNASIRVLLLLIFSFFLRPPMPLCLVEKCFWKLGYFCFPSFLIWFFHSRLMEINSTHVYFRSRMLCFDDGAKKDKNIFKEKSQSEHFMY